MQTGWKNEWSNLVEFKDKCKLLLLERKSLWHLCRMILLASGSSVEKQVSSNMSLSQQCPGTKEG